MHAMAVHATLTHFLSKFSVYKISTRQTSRHTYCAYSGKWNTLKIPVLWLLTLYMSQFLLVVESGSVCIDGKNTSSSPFLLFAGKIHLSNCFKGETMAWSRGHVARLFLVVVMTLSVSVNPVYRANSNLRKSGRKCWNSVKYGLWWTWPAKNSSLLPNLVISNNYFLIFLSLWNITSQ